MDTVADGGGGWAVNSWKDSSQKGTSAFPLHTSLVSPRTDTGVEQIKGDSETNKTTGLKSGCHTECRVQPGGPPATTKATTLIKEKYTSGSPQRKFRISRVKTKMARQRIRTLGCILEK